MSNNNNSSFDVLVSQVLKERAYNKLSEADRRGMPVKVVCNECGRKFKAHSYEPKCPKCHGYDVEPF